MHIGIDGSRCSSKKSTGVERYSLLVLLPLIKELKKRGHQVTIYARENSDVFNGANVKVFQLRYFWTHLFLGIKSQFDKVDCLFVPSHVLPIIRPKRNVLFVHDVCFEEFPEAYSFFDRIYLRFTTANAVRSANIITHSTSTKEKIANFYGAKKVTVIKPAAISVVKRETSIAWPKPYLLFVGRIETKKNVKLLLEAFDHLLSRKPEIKHNLVLLGKDGFGSAEIKDFAEKLRHKNRIIFNGYASDGLRDQALREASGLVLPSLCEGSSLVLLEARMARVPFASSACVPCVEAGGDTGIYVQKPTTANWITALENLIFKPVTPAPASYRTWEDVAREIAEVITS
ncbi:MAG: glycosyltransferase family 1 protein [bacterium]|nr:glycosyltransferase family 1 protein [bacterium]